MPRKAIPPLLLTALLAAAPAAAQDAEILFRKDIPRDEITGVVHWREAAHFRVEAPARCDRRWGDCFEPVEFDYLFGFDFFRERLTESDGVVERVSVPMGSIYVAVSLSRVQYDGFVEAMQRGIQNLSGDAFKDTFAGVNEAWPPLDMEHLAVSPEVPSWACFISEGGSRVAAFTRTAIEGPGGEAAWSIESATFTGLKWIKPFCADLHEGLEGSLRETLRTISSPQTVLTQEVLVTYDDNLPSRAAPGEVAPLPAGVTLSKVREPGVVSGFSRNYDPQRGVTIGTYTSDGVTWKGEAAPGEIPRESLTEALLARWEIRDTLHRLGTNPSARQLDSFSFNTATVPVIPPAFEHENNAPPGEERPEPPRIRTDWDAFTEALGRALEDRAGMTLASLEDAVLEAHRSLMVEGNYLLVCRPDGTADYFVSPLLLGNTVTNADEVCRELDRWIP